MATALLADRKKNTPLWVALVMTLLATAWMAFTDQADKASGESEQAGNALSVPPQRKATLSTVAIAPSAAKTETNDALSAGYTRLHIDKQPLPLFSSHSAVLPEATGTAAEAPQVPALPFTYAGKLTEDGQYTIFLLSGTRSLAVKKGDVLEGAWRIKAIKPPVMVFTYLPLHMDSSLDIGSATTIGESN